MLFSAVTSKRLLIFCAVIICACSDSSGPESLTIEKVLGDGQTVMAGEPGGQPVFVRVLQGARPAVNEPVYWRDVSGDTATTFADSDGRTGVNWYPCCTAGQAYSMEARTRGGQAVTFFANLVPGRPYIVSVQPSAAIYFLELNQTLQFVTQVRDRYANVITGRVPSWESLSPQIMSISATGLARGIRPGSGFLRVSIDDVSRTLDITVRSSGPY